MSDQRYAVVVNELAFFIKAESHEAAAKEGAFRYSAWRSVPGWESDWVVRVAEADRDHSSVHTFRLEPVVHVRDWHVKAKWGGDD